MRILVTGHQGFIGSCLVEQLRLTTHELILCDLSTGINIKNWDEVSAFSGVEVVIHLANLSFVPASFIDPKLFYETNYLTTLNMLELCRLNKARMIYFSSYMYGSPDYQPIDENHPTRAYNPYSQTKLIAESLCEGYNRDFKVPVTIFRPFNIYGKGQNPDFLIPTIISQAKTGKITIKDDRPKRDYIHVSDIVDAVLAAINQSDVSNEMQIYNLGSGISYSVKELIEIVCSYFENKIEYTCTNEIRQNEVMDTIADISKIKNELGWKPEVSLEQGIKELI
ncbi:MAG: NAD-dependent epimerase/dehydratase family protein [Paludibacter sp.]